MNVTELDVLGISVGSAVCLMFACVCMCCAVEKSCRAKEV